MSARFGSVVFVRRFACGAAIAKNVFWSANDRTIFIIVTKIKRFACLDGLATPPADGLAGFNEAGGPYAGGPVAAVIPARCRVASLLLALAVVGGAVAGAGVWDEGGAACVWAAAAGHGHYPCGEGHVPTC
jgi:hypothetical protein